MMEECTEGETPTARKSREREKLWFKRWFESLLLAFNRPTNQILRVTSWDMRNDQKYPLLALPRIPRYVEGSSAEHIAFVILYISAVGWSVRPNNPQVEHGIFTDIPHFVTPTKHANCTRMQKVLFSLLTRLKLGSSLMIESSLQPNPLSMNSLPGFTIQQY